MDAPTDLVALEGLIVELRGHPISHLSATPEASTPPRGTTPPGLGNIAYGLLPLETLQSNQSNSAAEGEKAGGNAGRMEGLSQASRDVNFASASPSVTSPVGELGRAADSLVSRAGSSHSDSTALGEGGLIDIDIASEQSSPFSKPSQQTPLANRSKILEKADSGKSMPLRIGEGDQRGDPMPLAGEEDPSWARSTNQSELSEEAGPDLRPAPDATEGGMIELAAVVPSSGGSPGSPPPSAATTEQRQGAEVKEIRMESGVALFHAFELATAPGQETDAAMQMADEPALPSEITAPPPPDVSPAPEMSASESQEPDQPAAHRASLLPTIAGTAFLVTLNGVFLRETSSRRRRPVV